MSKGSPELMRPDPPSLRAIFCEAVEIADPAERAAYLAIACGEDSTFRKEVEELLRADETAGGFMVTEADRGGSPRTPVAEATGHRIGRYQLLEKIGEGGCGVVYRAEQVEPVRRKVALKIIKLGMDTRSVIARFEAERQALALMDHPCIARILDAGATNSGRPYFVMELVQGSRITDFCDQNALPTPARLRLFARVCHAVQHAHLKGIVHRDLKPSNILVALHDGVASPRIIDFGIAKATLGTPLTEKTIHTQAEGFLGTPTYMSPEQAERGGLDIDSRTDVYSLGVLLYELLTGRTPFDPETLQKSGVENMRRIIRDTEPQRPSTRLRSLPAEDLNQVARSRFSQPLRLVSLVRGDLDWIVLKAMEKDRARRYETALELAHDVERFLNAEPIAARPPSRRYRIQKLVQRHNLLFGAIAAVGGALALGLSIAALMFFKERAAHQRAVAAEHTQSVLRQTADAAQQRAEAEADFSRKQLVRLSVQSGNKLIEEGDQHGALLWFAEALRLEHEDESVHRRRFAAALNSAPELKQLWFHEGFINDEDFDSDASHVATGGSDGFARVWNPTTGEAAAPALRHSDDVLQVRFLGDSSHLLTEDSKHHVRIWDWATGELTADYGELVSFDPDRLDKIGWTANRLQIAMPTTRGVEIIDAASGWKTPRALSLTNKVGHLRMSADGRRILAETSPETLQIYDATTGQALSPPLEHKPLRDFKFSADGTMALAIATYDMYGWNTGSGQALWEPITLTASVFGFDISPDNQLAVAAGWDGSVRLFDPRTGALQGEVMHPGGVARAHFSSDSRLVATASWNGTARLWQTRPFGPASPLLRHAGFVLRANFSRDNQLLLTGGPDPTTRLWSLTNQAMRLELPATNSYAMLLNPSGSQLMTTERDIARIWDVQTGRSRFELKHDGIVQGADFDATGKLLATVCHTGTLWLWDAERGERLLPPIKLAASGWQVCVSLDGRLAATGNSRDEIQIWNTTNGVQMGSSFQHTNHIKALTFSPDSQRLLTASLDHTARVSDAMGKELMVLQHETEVHHAEFSPDGKRILTACSDASEAHLSAQIWDAATGAKIGPPLSHVDGVLHATFSPDGRLVATGSEDRTAIVWDATTGARVTPPLVHGSIILRVAFSPDSRLLITCSEDGTARVWDAHTGAPVTPPLKHGGPVAFAKWTPDGNSVATLGREGRVRIWNLAPQTGTREELQRLAELVSAHRLDANGGFVPLTALELKERWEGLHPKPK